MAWAGAFVQDVGYAIRTLRRSPGFTTVLVMTLALGIGATTAIYSIVDTILLQPLPFAGSDRLVRVEYTPLLDAGRPPAQRGPSRRAGAQREPAGSRRPPTRAERHPRLQQGARAVRLRAGLPARRGDDSAAGGVREFLPRRGEGVRDRADADQGRSRPEDESGAAAFQLPLESFATGRYDCQLTVIDPTADQIASWRAPIVVVR
jgi:hypothetical protein